MAACKPAYYVKHSVLREFSGRVIEIPTKHKAIVQFHCDNQPQRALLWYDKLKVNGHLAPLGGTIDEYLKYNTQLQFLCHHLDDTGVDRCGWYITCAWQQSKQDSTLKNNTTTMYGLFNCTGYVLEVARRQGILTYDLNGEEQNILFLGSKLYVNGKRPSAKCNLNTLPGIEEGRSLGFDAVPCDPLENGGRCSWFATIVWKGRKPFRDYDDARSTRQVESGPLTPLQMIKLTISNPHCLFLRCEAEIFKLVNAEFCIALAAIRPNHWETVLFHRDQATLFDTSLEKVDLTTIFKEGDKIRVVAAAAPKVMGAKWVASQVRIYTHPSISHEFQF